MRGVAPLQVFRHAGSIRRAQPALQPDDGTERPLPELFLHRLEQIAGPGLFQLELTPPGHAEESGCLHRSIGIEDREIGGDDLLDRHEIAAGELHEPGQRAG